MSHADQVGVSDSKLTGNNTVPLFVAGNIVNFMSNWRQLTSDKWILNCVQGLTIPFVSLPQQVAAPFPFRMDHEELKFVKTEICSLLQKGVLQQVHELRDQWVSNIFLRPKPSGKFRMILDLTKLNKYIEYEHFKMFNLRTALDLLQPGMWMASADLTDAYYTLPINKEQRKFLRFRWEDTLFEYQVLPNGLSPGPRIFTKLLKPIYAAMGEKGFICFPYLDDSFVIGRTQEECLRAIEYLVYLFEQLGFTVNKEKSVLTPTRTLTFLGFILDSVRMEVRLTEEKKQKLVQVSEQILDTEQPSVRDVAGLVGMMVAYSPAVEYAGVHFKNLEKDKIKALKRCKGNFDRSMWISHEGEADIRWWLKNYHNPRKIRREDPDVELFTDASHAGWGAHTEELQTGGRWHATELTHINALELRAICFGLKSLCRKKGQHIRIRTDSTTALAYVKNMGGTKSVDCQQEALLIWEWAQEVEAWLTITHIPGVENVLADLRSRKFRDHLEWTLNRDIFLEICAEWGTPDVDLFASRINAQLDKYVSWEPEPDSWRTDAFSFAWTNHFVFCFPPFSLLPRVVRKIERDGAKAIVVAPHWPAQPWHPLLQETARRKLTFAKKEGNLIGPESLGLEQGTSMLGRTKLTAYLF